MEVHSRDRFGIDQTEFSLQENCLMRGVRAYIPEPLRKRVLEELHSSHFGISRMKSLARSYCWWNGIDKEIEDVSKSCTKCQLHQANPSKAPSHCWESAAGPFERVHADFAGPFMGVYFLILVDSYSKWPEVHVLKNITSSNTIECCRKIFACFGIPCIFVSDHGSQFTSAEFQNFLDLNGIIHKMGAPYHPATNGQAERYVRTIKEKLKVLNCSQSEINKYLCNILLDYRKSIHPATGKSPTQIMFYRQIRSRLDVMIPTKRSVEYEILPKSRTLQVNARVSVREYISKEKWRFGHVLNKIGQLHYLIKLDDGRIWKRHINQIREIGPDAGNLNCKNDKFYSQINDNLVITTQEHENFSNDVEHVRDDQALDAEVSTTLSVNTYNGVDRSESGMDEEVELAVPVVESHTDTIESNIGVDENNVRRSNRIRKPVQKLDL